MRTKTPPASSAVSRSAKQLNTVRGTSRRTVRLSRVLAQTSVNTSVSAGVIVGHLAGFDTNKQPLVTFSGIPRDLPRAALTTCRLGNQHVGCQVVLQFEEGNLARPVVLGVVVPPAAEAGVDVFFDGKRLNLSAEHEIVLRCGRASLTLTRAGKVIIEGAYVSSNSSGVNRIWGASIQIN
jgi:hypothetical protein